MKTQPQELAIIKLVGKCRGLAPAAASPRCTAAAASAAGTASKAATAAAATAATAATAPGDLLALWRCSIFLVEHVERRQAYVGDFFFTECDDLTRCGVLRMDVRHRAGG